MTSPLMVSVNVGACPPAAGACWPSGMGRQARHLPVDLRLVGAGLLVPVLGSAVRLPYRSSVRCVGSRCYIHPREI